MYVLVLKLRTRRCDLAIAAATMDREKAAIPPLNVIGGKGAAMSQSTAHANEIDVRSLIPAKRHEKIFQLVDELAPGASFVLVNDHDPKPLYYQLEAEHPKEFSWTYLERGPAVWRVEIGKMLKAA
jgi:uncharacterized protein (DUF2249 family)